MYPWSRLVSTCRDRRLVRPEPHGAGRGLRAAIAVALVACWWGSAGADGFLDADPGVDDADVLLAVRLQSDFLSEAMPARAGPDGVKLPLGELCRLLEIAIRVDANRGVAAGYFVTPKRPYRLDVPRRQVRSPGKSWGLDPERVEIHEGDLYVDSRLIATWLPFDLVIEPRTLLVRVLPREPLPVQLRAQRQKEIERALRDRERARRQWPRLDVPYRFWSSPFVDGKLVWTMQPEPGHGQRNLIQHTLHATSDLLRMEASLRVLGDSRAPLNDVRFVIGRRDPEAGLLGPLRAREISVGDVFHPGLELVSPQYAGTGFVLGNFPLQRPSQFDRHTFRGELPPDWEVELYRDRTLIDFSRSRADGLYEFVDVPLLFGPNHFHLVFYGPTGERREEVRVFDVQATMATPGQLYYRLVMNDPETAVPRALFELDWGFDRRLTATLGVAAVGESRAADRYGRVGVRTSWGRLQSGLQVVAKPAGGSAAEGRLRARFGQLTGTLQHAELRRFTSEVFRPLATPIRGRTTARLDGRTPLLVAIPLDLEVRRDELESRQSLYQAVGRTSIGWRGFFVTDRTQWVFSRGTPRAIEPRTTGMLLARKYLPRFSLGAQLDYEVAPRRQVVGIETGIETRVRGVAVSAGAYRGVVGRNLRWVFGLHKTDGRYGLALRADVDPRVGANVQLGISAGLSRDPRHGHWHAQARPVAATGAVSAAVFLDENGNGRFDAGEPPLENVSVALNGTTRGAPTGEDGTTWMGDLPGYHPNDVGVLLASLADPLWMPRSEAFRIVPRPASVARIDFPVTICGEIAGTVWLRQGGAERPASGVELVLVRSDGGEPTHRTRTAYDGFYDLVRVPPGAYELRVVPGSCPGPLAATPAPRRVDVPTAGVILDGVDFILESAGESLTSSGSE